MAFYLEKAIFVNRAPIEKLEIDFIHNGVNIFSAINGRGKTTIISHIVDAFYELAKKYYENEFEDRSKYYRISTGLDNLDNTKSSFVYLRFNKDGYPLDYIDIRRNCSQAEYDQAITITNKIPFLSLSNKLSSLGNVKFWHLPNDDKEYGISIFDNYVLTYFPSYRYEMPAYLNEPFQFKNEHKIDMLFSGHLDNPLEVVTGIRSITNWILDVVLDWINYKETSKVQTPDGSIQTIDLSPELNLWQNLNTIIRETLTSKKAEGLIRLGIGKRNVGVERVSVVDDNNGNISQISPNLFCLSSGELAIISCYAEILRQADVIHPNIPLENIQGIVLIDEVEKHLHIKLQKEILPRLFKLFPNVQFIVSSHSPFYGMGMAETMSEKTQIIDLDNNGICTSPTKNDQYLEVYNMMIEENDRFAKKFNKLEEEISRLRNPIVITEGKTDIKHILKAKEKLGLTGIVFDVIQTDKQPDGDEDLIKLLEQLSKIQRTNIVIGILDHDNPKIIPKIEKNGQKIRDFGNGVYAFCIPVPASRIESGQEKISIEYLYSDDEIETILDNGCRLFFGSEFNKRTGRHISDPTLILGNQDGRGEDKILENNGKQAVYDNFENNHLAKKDDFAEAIINDKISISDNSWNNFRPIFDLIQQILA